MDWASIPSCVREAWALLAPVRDTVLLCQYYVVTEGLLKRRTQAKLLALAIVHQYHHLRSIYEQYALLQTSRVVLVWSLPVAVQLLEAEYSTSWVSLAAKESS